jgi:hypothetical protein
MPAIASAADITVNDDATGAGPAGANCAAPDHATITGALAAANSSGDRVLVCAGTYVQPQVLIEKSVELIGAGPGESIIDGANATGLPSAGLIRTNDNTNGDVLVKGFTVQNPGQVGVSPTANRITVIPKGNDLGTTQEFVDLEIVGEGEGGRDYGFDADNPDPNVILRDSSITNTDYNPVLIERADGAVTVRDNEISSSGSGVFTMNHTNDPSSNPVRFIDNEIDPQGGSGLSVQSSFTNLGTPGSFNSIVVRGNDFVNVGVIGIAITNPTAGNGVAGEIANVDIDENTIGMSVAGSGTGVRIQGLARNVAITGNTLTGAATGILVNPASAGHVPVDVRARFNRIAGNATAGLTSNVSEPVSAEHNWWGCNEGPGAAGCDAVTGSGSAAVDFDPWLVLGLTATPDVIDARGGTSTLVADVTTDSDGNAAGAGFPEGTPVGFATTLGTVQTPVGTASGVATSTLASGNEGGVADVTATLDNAEVADQVGINPPPADPREVEPTPRAADLRLTVTPKRKLIEGGTSVRYTATVRNAGEAAATDMVLCARTPKKLTLKGTGCAEIGTLAAGAEFTAKFKVTTPDIPWRMYRIRFNAAGADVKGAKTRAKLKTHS